MSERRVGGERVADLERALRYFKTTRLPDGCVDVECEIPPPFALPFRRALMRVEAELLLREADEVTAPSAIKTAEARAAAALVELVKRVSGVRG